MANEITVQTSLSVSKGNNKFSKSRRFQADVDAAVAKGPVPGAISVSVEGTDIDLTELQDPAWGVIENIGATYPILVGKWDPEALIFHDFCYLEPGQSFPLCLPPGFGGEYVGTGTGTTAATGSLRIKGVGGPGVALAEFFER
jgi:hypothetical protein